MTATKAVMCSCGAWLRRFFKRVMLIFFAVFSHLILCCVLPFEIHIRLCCLEIKGNILHEDNKKTVKDHARKVKDKYGAELIMTRL